jgi:single-strand DNA-binding protein
MGRLTKDPEMRYTATNNIPKCTFTLAVDRRFAKQGEERQVDFINIVTWKNTAEFCGKHFTKGLKVAVIGSLQNRSWDDTEGKKHYATEVIADEAYFAEGKKSESNNGGQSSGSSGDQGFFPPDDDNELPF